jgi:hypothetical protein
MADLLPARWKPAEYLTCPDLTKLRVAAESLRCFGNELPNRLNFDRCDWGVLRPGSPYRPDRGLDRLTELASELDRYIESVGDIPPPWVIAVPTVSHFVNEMNALHRLAFDAARVYSALAESAPVQQSPAEQTMPEESVGAGRKAKGKHINARMMKLIEEKPEAWNWSARQFAVCLDCSDGTVKGTAKWKELVIARAVAKVDRVLRQERRST